MSLTSGQLATIKAYIVADNGLNALPNTNVGNSQIANTLNAQASPDFYVWLSSYTPELKAAAIDNGITQVDNLTASKRDTLLWWAARTHDASKAATQAAMSDLCGMQNTLKAALIDGAKRKAKVIEKILATGTGSLASPATPGYEGTITPDEIEQARSLP